MEGKSRIGSVAAGIAGVAVTAAALSLLDKGNRKRVGKVLHNITKKGKMMTDKAVHKLDTVDDHVDTVQKVYRKQKKKVAAVAK